MSKGFAISVIASVTLLILFNPHLLGAQGLADYRCTILNVAAARDDGSIGPTAWTDMAAGVLVGTEFAVIRRTGQIINSLLKNENPPYGSPQVVDNGSFEQSYKVITVFHPYAEVYYLRIEENTEGATKPFLFLQGRELYTGTCEHFRGGKQ